MKTLVGTGEGPEKYNGYKPADKNPYVPSRGEEQKKAKRGYDNVGPNTYPDGYQPAPKNPYGPKEVKGKTQPGPKDFKPETKKPKSGYGQGVPNVYPDGSYPTPNEMYPPAEKGYQEQQKAKKKLPFDRSPFPAPKPGDRASKNLMEGDYYYGYDRHTRDTGPNNPPPSGWPTTSQVEGYKMSGKIKSTLRGGMGAGRGDNPHGTQGYF